MTEEELTELRSRCQGFEFALGRIYGAWKEWRKHHDIVSVEISCCDRTRELHARLEALRIFFDGPVKH